jgi:hypothetical protein
MYGRFAAQWRPRDMRRVRAAAKFFASFFKK